MNTDFARLKHDSDKGINKLVFTEPWEAHAFAIAVKLSEKGIFKWSEFSEALAKEIKLAKQRRVPDFGNTYYHIWLSALETILIDKNILKISDLKRSMKQWRRAYLSNPHGKPVNIVKYK